MRKVRPVHHLSWFTTDSWCTKAPPSTRELNRHGRCCGFLDCLEAKLWTGSRSAVNHGTACAWTASLPASTWGHAGRDTPTSLVCAYFQRESFSKTMVVTCASWCLFPCMLLAFCGDQTSGRTGQLSLSQKAFLVGGKKQPNKQL